MNTNSRTKNTLLNLFTGLGGQLFQVLLKFVTRTIFIQVLGSVYLGVNGLFTDILTLLSISEMGFDTAINYKFYKPLADGDTKRLQALVNFYKKIYVVVGSFIFTVGICLIPFLKYIIKDSQLLDDLGINVALLFLLYLFQSTSSYWFFTYKSAVIKADQKSYLLNITQMFVTIISSIVQIIVLLILKDFIAYTLVVIIASIFENWLYSKISDRLYPELFFHNNESFSKEEAVSVFKDCGALLIYKLNGVITRGTGNVILSTFVGLVIVGLYSNYLLIFNTTNTILRKFYDACKASMGNVFAQDNIKKSYFLFEVMNYLTILLYGTAGVCVALLSNEFVLLWLGEDYVFSQSIPVLIGIELLLNGIKNNLGQVRNVTGIFRQMWFRPVLGIIINLAVALLLVKRLGIIAVLLGIIISTILTNFLVDPIVINKYSFSSYKSNWYYYRKNLGYFFTLIMSTISLYYIFLIVSLDNMILSLFVHFLICVIFVPAVLIVVYYHTKVTQYVCHSFIYLILKRNGKHEI